MDGPVTGDITQWCASMPDGTTKCSVNGPLYTVNTDPTTNGGVVYDGVFHSVNAGPQPPQPQAPTTNDTPLPPQQQQQQQQQSQVQAPPVVPPVQEAQPAATTPTTTTTTNNHNNDAVTWNAVKDTEQRRLRHNY